MNLLVDFFLPKKRDSSLEDHFSIGKSLEQIDLPDAQNVQQLLELLPNSDCMRKVHDILIHYPMTSLLSAVGQSILFLFLRYLKPKYVLEIGTYKAGTTEILVRALQLNDQGTLITINPYGESTVPLILNKWSPDLKQYLVYQSVSSMNYFMQKDPRIQFDLLFVDGDHSYEYALFDLRMAARHATPGAVIVMDNAEQAGVYWAAKHFLSLNPGWRELGSSIANHDLSKPFTTMNPSFPDTDFLILQGPEKSMIVNRPKSFEIESTSARGLAGFDLSFRGKQDDGSLSLLIYFRSFMHGGFSGNPEQQMQMMSLPVKKGDTSYRLKLEQPFITCHVPEHLFRLFEIVLSWKAYGNLSSLELTVPPNPIEIQ